MEIRDRYKIYKRKMPAALFEKTYEMHPLIDFIHIFYPSKK